MLKTEQFLIDRVNKGSLDYKTFLDPKESEFDQFHFNLIGVSDSKFITKLSKLIKSEQEPKVRKKNVPKATENFQK